MTSTEDIYGSLLFLRKDGQPSTTYSLRNGKTTIGSSGDADIRFKMNNQLLEEIHCIIEVNDVGIATLSNKSVSEPVKINSVPIRKSRILQVDDEIELVGKKFVYLNGKSTNKDSDKLQKNVKKVKSSPSKRHSINLINLHSEKKSPNFKTKIPRQIRPSTRTSCTSTSSDFTVTYEKEPDKGHVPDKSKTTSKVIVSKAVGSSRTLKRRLSYGDQPRNIDKNPKMSTRNVLLSKNIISTITEEENPTSLKRSASMTRLEKSSKQNVERSMRLDSGDMSLEDLIKLNLSSNSSLSPIESSPGNTTSSSSRKSTSRKSLTKKHLTEGSVTKSPRNSLLRHCLQKNQHESLTKSRQSLQKRKTGEFSEQSSSEESSMPNKPSRNSLRKSKTIEITKNEQLDEQFLNGESEEESDEFERNETDRNVEELYETQSSSEESLPLPESHTPNKHSRKSKQSLNKSKTIESPNPRQSLRKSKTGEFNKQFSSEEFPTPNKSARHSRESKTMDIRDQEQLEQFLSDESDEESNVSLSLRTSGTGRNIDEMYETQSSSEESSPRRTPIKYLRKSRQSLNKSETVEVSNPRQSLRKSKIGEINKQTSSEESPASSKSARLSSRKSNMTEKREEEPPEAEFEKEFNKVHSSRTSKTDRTLDEPNETQSLSEELFSPKSHTPNKHLRKSKLSLNKSKTVESPNESVISSVTRMSRTIENGKEQLNEELDITKSRQSLRKSKSAGRERRQSEQNKESPIFESPNKSCVRARSSMSLNTGKQENHSEEQSSDESESTSAINTLATPKQRKSLKSNSVTDHQDSPRGLSINLTKLKTPNSEASNGRRFSIKKSLGAESLLNTSVGPRGVNTPIQRRSSVRNSSRPNRKEEILKSQSSIELSVANVSTMSTPKEVPKRRQSTTSKTIASSARKSTGLNQDEDIGEPSSSEESLFVSVSPMSAKKIFMQRRLMTPKETVSSVRTLKMRASSIGKSNMLNENEQSIAENSLDFNISLLNSPTEISTKRPSSTPKETRTSLRKSRKSSIRNSNGLNKDEEIGELPYNEGSLGPNDSSNNTPNQKSVQRRATAIPKELSSVKEGRFSPRKSNRLDQDEEIREQSFSEESFVLNISGPNSPEETQELSTILKESVISTEPLKERGSSVRKSRRLSTNEERDEVILSRTSTERRSSVRKSNKLNRDVDTLEVSSSEVFLSPNISDMNTSVELSVQRHSTMTPKQISSVKTPKERRSSVGRNSKLSESVESLKLSSSEESLVLNISAKNRSSTRKSNKSIRDDQIGELSSHGELLVSNVSTMNTPKETSVQKRLTTTPKELVTVGTPNKSTTSVRKSNRLSQEKEIDDLSSSEESLDLGVSIIDSPKEKSIRKLSTTPQERESVSAMNRRSSVRKNNKSIRDEESPGGDWSVPIISPMNTPKETSAQRRLTATPKELTISLGTSSGIRTSARKSNRLSKKEQVNDLASSAESLNCGISTPKEKSIRRLSTTSKERRSSVNTNAALIRDKEIDDLPSSEDSFISSMNGSVDETVEKQSSTTKRSMNERRSSNQNSLIYMSDSKNSTPLPASHKNNITNERFEHSNYSSDNESEFSMESPLDRITPKLRHSSVRKSHLKPEEEASETETSFDKSSRSRSSSRRSSKNISVSKLDKAPLTHSKQNISVITLNDSVELTPENNTSVIIINSSLEKTQKSSRKRLSKTLNSTLQDVELTTPKSAIKTRRPKSLPYNPLVEDITPVTPLNKSKNDSGFKTPLNTPGLFEDIKKSVLRSRSQIQKSSTNLMEELNKSEPKRGTKRPRLEGSYVEASKRRRIRSSDTLDTDQEADSRSFESFATDDCLTDISEQNITQNTPKHFSDLTDKPVITHPQMRSSVEPKGRKSKSRRESLHSMRLSSQDSSDDSPPDAILISQTSSSEQDDSIFEGTTSDLSSRRSSRRSSLRSRTTEENDSPVNVQKSPKNDLSDVAGLKRLLKTPREIKSPKNDLTNVPNIRRLMYPRTNNSPRNDLTNIVGVKKLLATPKQTKSPKNDLTQIPNLRKLMSPKQQNSPKNDLSDVAGVKKLLGTPKQIASPKNDLRNVPNLRRFMSPKIQNDPKNDLTDVGGVKKLFTTPKYQKSPKNDLTNVPNLRRIMSPKQQNTPKNDLTDVDGLKRLMATPRENKELQNDMAGGDNIFNVSGVQRLSIESDIENNEDLFDKLFAKKPLKTYRGKSLSPASRKAMMFDDKRKTLGDVPYTSPRVEKWIEEQAVIKLNRNEDAHEDEVLEKTQGTPAKGTITDVHQDSQKKRGRGRRMEKKAIKETSTLEELAVYKDKNVSPKKGKANVQEIADDTISSANKDSEEESPKKGVKSRNISPFIKEENKVEKKRKLDQLDDKPDVKLVKKSTRSRRKLEEDVRKEDAQEYLEKKPKARQITMVVDKDQSNEVSNTNESAADEVNSTNGSKFKVPQVTRGRVKKTLQTDDIDQIPEVHSTTEDIKSPAPKRGRGRGARAIDQDENTEVLAPSPRRGGRVRNAAQVEKLDKIKIEWKDEELPQPKRLRGKRKSPVKKDEDSETESTVKSVENEEPHPKRGRGKNIKVVNKEEQTTDDSDNTPLITKRTRGRKQNEVASESNSDVTTSAERAHQNEVELEISEVEKDNKTEKRKVGRNKKKIAEEETENEDQKEMEPVKSTRARKQPTAIKVESVEENDIELASSKSTRGRKRLVKTGNKPEGSEERESDPSEVDDTKMVSTKPTRGRKQLEKTTNKPEESEEQESYPSEVDDVKIVSAKPTRGRKRLEKTTNKLEGSEERENEPTDAMEVASAKPTRGRKRLGKTIIEVEGSEDGKSGPTEIDDVESTKPARGRKRLGKTTIKVEESEKENSAPTEVDDMESGKPGRGRKRVEKTTNQLGGSEDKESGFSSEVNDTNITSLKLTRGKKQLNKIGGTEEGESGPIEVDDTEIASAKPTRGRKRLGKTTNKLEGSEEGESESSENDGAKMASTKPIRGRKRIEERTATLEEKESEVNKASRSNKKPAEDIDYVEDEKTVAKPTRGRKPKVVDNAKLVEDSILVDSPRTARLKRGNFNKYGSDFLTERGKKEENREKKRVRFEEKEENTNNKLRDRNVAKTEEVEETTIRKSKRARK